MKELLAVIFHTQTSWWTSLDIIA